MRKINHTIYNHSIYNYSEIFQDRPFSCRLHPGTLFLMLLLAVFLNTAAAAAHRICLQRGIAEEVLRFHVIANSDREDDQAVKYLVRDAVLEWADASENFSSQNSAEKEITLAFYTEHLSEIESIANKVLEEQNMSYRATAEICQSYFPDRTYGDCTFPAGWYQALRICLGDANGQNWWCLLYPSLCFSDALHAVMKEDSQEILEEILTVEEYQSLLKTPSSWQISFKWFRFPVRVSEK